VGISAKRKDLIESESPGGPLDAVRAKWWEEDIGHYAARLLQEPMP
jgi:hypothetical protein